jgi:hypothetical protein
MPAARRRIAGRHPKSAASFLNRPVDLVLERVPASAPSTPANSSEASMSATPRAPCFDSTPCTATAPCRQTADEVLAQQLSPLLHANQPSSPRRIRTTKRGSEAPGRLRHPQGRSDFNRQRGPVFNRRRQRRRAASIRCLLRKLKAGSSRPVVVFGWTGRVLTNVEATCADKEVARWPLTYVASLEQPQRPRSAT